MRPNLSAVFPHATRHVTAKPLPAWHVFFLVAVSALERLILSRACFFRIMLTERFLS